MRRFVLLLFICVVSMVAKAQFTTYKPLIPNNSRSAPVAPPSIGPFSVYTPSETIVRGTTYYATVGYESSTGHKNVYTLPVVVNNGSVEKIIFNENGGCVHVGINHSGYKYYGGDLEYVRDVDAYFTEVTIVYSDFWQKFSIFIE